MKEHSPCILQAEGLCKVFSGPQPLQILQNVSLQVHQGESVAIIGKSGSGKSSLLHILGTLDNPTSGTLTICGQKALSQAPSIRKKHLGFVFQSFHLLEDYTLLENILMPSYILRKKAPYGSPVHARAKELLSFVGLEDKEHLPAKLLSGGEKQRAALARAFCNNPDLLLVDEPTGNLDPVNAKLVEELLLKKCKEENKALILVTHDQDFAFLCDKVFVLKDAALSELK